MGIDEKLDFDFVKVDRRTSLRVKMEATAVLSTIHIRLTDMAMLLSGEALGLPVAKYRTGYFIMISKQKLNEHLTKFKRAGASEELLSILRMAANETGIDCLKLDAAGPCISGLPKQPFGRQHSPGPGNIVSETITLETRPG